MAGASLAAMDPGQLWMLLRRRLEDEICACNSLYDSRVWKLDTGDVRVRVGAAEDRDDSISVLFDGVAREVTCIFGRNTLTPLQVARIRIEGLASVETILGRILNALRFPD